MPCSFAARCQPATTSSAAIAYTPGAGGALVIPRRATGNPALAHVPSPLVTGLDPLTSHAGGITDPLDGAGRRILVLSRAKVGERMAWPGIRPYHIAASLGRLLPGAGITVAIPTQPQGMPNPAAAVRVPQYGSDGGATPLAGTHGVGIS